MIAQTVLQPVSEVPLHITILCYAAVVILALILFLLFRVSGQLTGLSHRLKKAARSESPVSSPSDPEAPAIEVGSGTPFEKFLNEDPAHRMLSKKEQFKAYRKWRAEKGLNWSA